MKKNKFDNKKPIELKPEEMIELISSIAVIEYSRKKDILLYETAEDGAYDMYTYLSEISAKGRRGLKELQEEYTMPHFINFLHMECRNHINYILRMKRTKKMLYETDSLEKTLECSDDDTRMLINTLADERELAKTEEMLDLDAILSKVDSTENSSILIKYNDKVETTYNFSYQRLTRLYYLLAENKKLTASRFRGLLLDAKTHEELSDKDIRKILSDFRQYFKDDVLGGEVL